MLKGILGVLILSLLAARDDYGYALVLRLREAGLDDIAEGTVYPALTRCERSSWLRSYYVPSPSGPSRKYYQVTSDGMAELDRALQSWTHLSRLVNDLSSKELRRSAGILRHRLSGTTGTSQRAARQPGRLRA